MKRMLINATQEEELRMAMVDGQQLYDLNIELPASERKKANIYKGQITRIEPSLEAAFVNYGAERHGFLPLKEISPEYFVKDVESGKKINIKDVLREGQDIVVQIDKEERGNKGAALTTYVSLAGRFIVLKPNKQRSGGVSRRIVGEDRDLARKSMRDVEVPDGMSVILRTAGIDRSEEELSWDVENLLAVWEAIKKVVVERSSPFLIYRESNAVIRALRDYLTNEIGEILVDDEATYKEAQEFVEQVMPHNLRKLKLYTDAVPLFTRYQIESQIESAFAHTVTLPSGGSLVIDHTEALVSIDINSARATKGGDIEATALNTNLEAADEIARQLRLRDLGGLIVIDFIDMGPQRNQRDVENRLRDAVRQDRARVQLGKISRFGLLEMSRQRLRPSLGESSYLICPRCTGIGNIRSVESLALAILRIIGEEARKERTAKVIAQLPVEVATYLLNEKRDWVQSLETRHDTQVILVANSALETPHYQVRRVRDDQVDLPENVGNSFMLVEKDDEPEITQAMQDKKPAEVAAITTVVATTPAPPRREPEKKSGPGLLARIASIFSGSSDKDETKAKPARKNTRKKQDASRRGGDQNRKRKDSQRQQGKKTTKRANKKSTKKRGKKTSGNDADRNANQSNRNNGAQAKSDSADDGRQEQRKDARPAPSKRRSRGGRRRRRNNESNDNNQNVSAQDGADKQGTDSVTEQTTQEKKVERKPARKPRRSAESRDTDGGKTSTSDKSAQDNVNGDQARDTRTSANGSDTAHAPREASNTKPSTAAKPEAKDAQATAPSQAARNVPDTPPPRQKARPDGYEDTQPALPVLKMDRNGENREQRAPEARGEAPPAPKAEKPADQVAKSSGNGESTVSKPVDPVVATPPDNKPAARLLPWEPATETTKPADKD